MKRILSTIIMAAAVFAIAGCEQFSTSYQRVDEREFRLLNFIYEPADAAPGDTVTLRAVFAGRSVELGEHLEWWVSFNVIRDLFGSETVVDSARLEGHIAGPPDYTPFSPNTQAVAFRIVIPGDMVRRSVSIPEAWTDVVPPYLTGAIPAALASASKSQVVDAIEAYAAGDAEGGRLIAENRAYLTALLQFFTVPMRVTAKVRSEPGRLPHTIRSSQTIRYNSRLSAGLGGNTAINSASQMIPVNYNPAIYAVVMYKVKGEDVSSIDNKEGLEYEEITLKSREVVRDVVRDVPVWDGNAGREPSSGALPVVEVERGYSYFVDALTGNRDFTVSMFGNVIEEKHYVYRQFRLDPEETAGIHHTKFMDISNFNGKIALPGDRRITKFTIWVTVKDEVANERLRPEGSMLAEASGMFVYK